jgi:hypothetical protein
MRKLNPSTTSGDKALLWMYWLASGYGERALPAALWFVAIIFGGVAMYLHTGLVPKDGGAPIEWGWHLTGSWRGIGDALIYSARTSLLLKPDDFVLPSLLAKIVSLLQSTTACLTYNQVFKDPIPPW